MSEQLVQDTVDVVCPSCGADSPRPFGTERGFTVVRCGACGILYVTPRLSHDALQRLYAEYYHKKEHWQQYLADTGTASVGAKKNATPPDEWNNRFTTLWPQMERALPVREEKTPLRALDVGGGTSAWSNWLRERGAECWIYEIADNPYSLAAKEQSETKETPPPVRWAIHPDIAQADLPESYFDLITLWDVMEHLENPDATLAACRRTLKPDGVLFIQTPNAWWFRLKYYAAQWLPRRWLGSMISEYGLLLPEQHLQYFSISALTAQLRRHGFAVTGQTVLDWGEAKGSFVARLIFGIVYWQARLVHCLTGGRGCTNIALSMFAKRNDK